MNPTPARPSASSKVPAQPSVPTTVQERVAKPVTAPVARKRHGFGLPCAKCRTYYASDDKVCPVCKGTERMSPNAAPLRPTVATSEQLPDPIALEEERERFLKEFKAQVFASQMPGNLPASNLCTKEENHHGVPAEPAAVCKSCFEQMQERVDVLEAALQIDLKEAAQIVYDAVWADPSDANKTYLNAAHALLSELRRRSGVTPTFRPMQPLLD